MSAPPAPTPTASPTPTAAPSPSPSPSHGLDPPSAAPTVSPAPTAAPTAIPTFPSPTPSAPALTAVKPGSPPSVRRLRAGRRHRRGRPHGHAAVLFIADSTGGLPVRLPDGVPASARGSLLELTGRSPPTLRPDRAPAGPWRPVGPWGGYAPGAGGHRRRCDRRSHRRSPGPRRRRDHRIGVTLASGDLSFSITGTDGSTARSWRTPPPASTCRSCARASSQRSPASSASGHRAREPSTATGSGSATRRPRGTSSPSPTRHRGVAHAQGRAVAEAARLGVEASRDLHRRPCSERAGVTVEGTLTDRARPSSMRRADASILEDSTAAIELYLAAPDACAPPGVRGPGHRHRRTSLECAAPARRRHPRHRLATATVHAVHTTPSAAIEWRLVSLRGAVLDVHH